tara:strand:- start:507 stop:725 length:219 start_codon:yes stop_codon:yes gene_type:complete
MEKIYIKNIEMFYGGSNGEVNIETDDGKTLCFSAYELMKNLPTIMELTFNEVAKEKNQIKVKYDRVIELIEK